MKYIVQVGEERIEVGLDADGVHVGGEEIRGHLYEISGTPIHLLELDGRTERVVARRGDGRGRYVLWIRGHRVEVEALDERTRAIRDLSNATSGPKGPAPLVAPMPGLIVRVTVAPGDQVTAGQGLVVMEAMKMENELRATAGGTVKAVHATPGTAVEKGTVLVELE